MGMISKTTTPEEAQAIETTLYHAVIAAIPEPTSPTATHPGNLPPTQIHPKVISSTVVGAGISLGAGILSLFHVNVPTDVLQSVTVVASAAAGYLTPSK